MLVTRDKWSVVLLNYLSQIMNVSPDLSLPHIIISVHDGFLHVSLRSRYQPDYQPDYHQSRVGRVISPRLPALCHSGHSGHTVRW